jgi:carbonic anhydrase/acetyltransferase-like protein (isoleucine patch superfamily)
VFRFVRLVAAVLVGCKISNSVLGENTYVGRGTIIESSMLMGNGAWVSDSQRLEALERGDRVYGVGEPRILFFPFLPFSFHLT